MYDPLSRLTQVATPDNTLAYSYDPEGNLTAANDNDSALIFRYDPLNRVVTANTLAASGAQPVTALSYLYDARHNLLSIADSAGGTTRHAWDKADRLRDVQTAAGDHIGLAYDLAGRMTGMTFPNGVVTTATFDTGGRISALTSVGSAGSLSAYGHLYDARGDISSITELNQVKSYSYDALERLKTGGTAQAPEAYSYDPEGNRTSSHLSTTYVTDAANRLLEDDTFRCVYDGNGNLSTKTEKANGAVTTYR